MPDSVSLRCGQTSIPPIGKARRILILNWRDIAHPRAGGAEKVTHEIARRWVAWGHHVTLFCASFPGAADEESIDGVHIVRRGRQQTVHWAAYQYYRGRARGRYDIVIDEVNTIPFFAPLYAREPVILYSNQLAREVWRYEAPFPVNALGYIAEPMYMQAYRHTPIMTISCSTERDLRGLGLKGPCHIIPMAVDMPVSERLPAIEIKEPALTLAFVGRVVPSKRVDHTIEALSLIHQSHDANAHLWIIGSWDERHKLALDRRITSLGLGSYVTFWGPVEAATKERLLARAHALVMTSVREGWGLVVTEANALGTPAVVYNVPGLRDSTRDGETGLVCAENTPASLAQAIMTLYGQRTLYNRLRNEAWASAKTLNWDRSARAAWDAVEAYL